jgi:hypothetical protein
MLAYIGGYRRHISYYKAVKSLRKLGVSDETCEKIIDRIGNSWVQKIFDWRNEKLSNPTRRAIVKIDGHDLWSLDFTLALIIHPCLVKFKDSGCGVPQVDNEDVPPELNVDFDPNKYDGDDWKPTMDKMIKRWHYVIDEMIWAFGTHVKSNIGKDESDKFYTGNIDLSVQPKEGESELFTIVEGPNHTHKVDREGLKAYELRKQNGYRLFGKYYQALWN